MKKKREKKPDRPSLTPININEDVWFYEAEKSLEFVAYGRDSNGNRFLKPAMFRVRRSKLQN